MKVLLLFTLIFLSRFATGQDCESLTREVDKFNGKVKVFSNLLDQVAFWKDITKTKVSYTMLLHTNDGYLSINSKGIIILLEGGKRINKPTVKVDVEVSDSGNYEYSVWMPMTPADIALLKSNKITDFRLGIFDASLDEEERQKALDSLNCVLKSK